MKTKSVHWTRCAGAYELIFFMIMLVLSMYWVVNSLMPDPGDNKPRILKRLSLMNAAEENADKMSEARKAQNEAMDRAAGVAEEEGDAK